MIWNKEIHKLYVYSRYKAQQPDSMTNSETEIENHITQSTGSVFLQKLSEY